MTPGQVGGKMGTLTLPNVPLGVELLLPDERQRSGGERLAKYTSTGEIS